MGLTPAFTPVHILLLAMIMVVLLDRFKCCWYVFALLVFPSTLLHEMSHFLTALITLGKPLRINLIPQRKAGGFQLGTIVITNFTWFNSGIISLSPLLLIPCALLILQVGVPLTTSLLQMVFFAYLLASMIYGCFPSILDWRIAWRHPFGSMIAFSFICLTIYIAIDGESLRRIEKFVEFEKFKHHFIEFIRIR